MSKIFFGETEFIPRIDRTLWHKNSGTLFLSDLHLGKGSHFRQSGIPVPHQSEKADFDRLIMAINETQANSIWILGDLFHYPKSITNQQLAEWNSLWSSVTCKLNVILGNHDRSGGCFARELGFQIYPEPTIWNDIELSHHPDDGSQLRISGHIHPQVELKSKTDRLVFPCFAIIQERQLLLPAFTEFSGGPRLRSCEAECFAITPSGVLSLRN